MTEDVQEPDRPWLWRGRLMWLFAIGSAVWIVLVYLIGDAWVPAEYEHIAYTAIMLVAFPSFLFAGLVGSFSSVFIWPDAIPDDVFLMFLVLPSAFFWAFVGFLIGTALDKGRNEKLRR